MEKIRIRIQDLEFGDGFTAEQTKEMFYRSDKIIRKNDQNAYVLKPAYYDFTTYFNSFSVYAWNKYTAVSDYQLEMDLQGNVSIEIMGHYIRHDGEVRKEWLGRYLYSFKQCTHIAIQIPVGMSDVIAFQITANKTAYIYDGWYSAAVAQEEVIQPYIKLQTHIRKNDHTIRNMLRIMLSELNRNEELAGGYLVEFLCADNVSRDMSFGDDLFRLIQEQKIRQEKYIRPVTHVLDVYDSTLVTEACLFRLYHFCSVLKERYRAYQVSAQVFSMDDPNRMFENAGLFSIAPSDEEYLSSLDMNQWDSVIRSEVMIPDSTRCFTGWNFNCRSVDQKTAEGIISTNGICIWQFSAENLPENEQEGRHYRLQNLLLHTDTITDNTRDMYYRGNTEIVKNENGELTLQPDFYDFSTYFNSLSVAKWRKYTIAEDFSLEFDIAGEFVIELMGHSVAKDKQIKKEWLGRYRLNCPYRKHISLKIPVSTSEVIAFQISTLRETVIYDGYYSARVDTEKTNDPFITLATTTFKKEEYVRRNVQLLNKSIFTDQELANHFSWKIVDNGSTLDPEEFKNEYIEVIPNRNVGGAGGFCRGMLAALEQKSKPSHILLMDDDVLFMPDSFHRVYQLLKLLKPEYTDYFISGAMLEINQRNIQHEDIGEFRENGEHGPAKPRYDLNIWTSVILNEVQLPADSHQYSGWWFCCIPTSIARQDNLPQPFFIRGDDVEYSIRNNAKFITMNGICIWHEGFGTKFSGAMEFYQVHRNDLILQAMHDTVSDVKVIDRIKELFWQELYKFNYKGCELLLDAVEDYLKGPEFIMQLNGESCMKEHRAKDNTLDPITDEVRAQIDYEKLYVYEPIAGMKKWIYDYTCNGQKRMTFLNKKSANGVIPYGWGYYQSKMCMVNRIIAVDPINDIYVVYEKNIKKFKELSSKYSKLIEKYESTNENVKQCYMSQEKMMESKLFWQDYLAKY